MPLTEKSQRNFKHFPLAEADGCVKCGLCLPHCPTYTQTGLEGDSPRGRIALMQGLAQGALQPEGRTTEHLDGCLTCRACEPVCPASVPYGRLIDAGRDALWQGGHRPGWRWRMLAWWRRTPGRIDMLGRLLRLLTATRLARLLRRLPGLGRSIDLLSPALAWPRPGTYPSTASPLGHVGLFLGCVARPLDAPVAWSAIELLNALGFTVEIPRSQRCCGAMDQHAGDHATASDLLGWNEAAFSEVDAVLATASGCGIHLKENSSLPLHSAADFIGRELELALQENRIQLREKPLEVLVHSPCTLKQMQADGGVMRLLSLLPGVHAIPLPHAHCCGAAGSYLFEHAEMSRRLGRATWAVVESQQADLLVTSNIGCALQLRHEGRRSALRVCHPLELAAARLNS